jgi:cytochrome c
MQQGLWLSASLLCLVVSIGCGAAAESPRREAELTARGEKVFSKCAGCHLSRSGDVAIGPSLAGVFGRKAGSMPGFRYSQALTSSGVVWDARTLSSLVRDPDGYIRGINMTASPLTDSADVEALIAYLRQLR